MTQNSVKGHGARAIPPLWITSMSPYAFLPPELHLILSLCPGDWPAGRRPLRITANECAPATHGKPVFQWLSISVMASSSERDTIVLQI